MADVDPLNRRVVEQMLLGVPTRRYVRSLEPVPATMRSPGTSKSAVSRRFVAKTAAQLAAADRVARGARSGRAADRRR
jgi:putative transposase